MATEQQPKRSKTGENLIITGVVMEMASILTGSHIPLIITWINRELAQRSVELSGVLMVGGLPVIVLGYYLENRKR